MQGNFAKIYYKFKLKTWKLVYKQFFDFDHIIQNLKAITWVTDKGYFNGGNEKENI